MESVERPLEEDALSRAEEAREAVEPRPGRYKARALPTMLTLPVR